MHKQIKSLTGGFGIWNEFDDVALNRNVGQLSVVKWFKRESRSTWEHHAMFTGTSHDPRNETYENALHWLLTNCNQTVYLIASVPTGNYKVSLLHFNDFTIAYNLCFEYYCDMYVLGFRVSVVFTSNSSFFSPILPWHQKHAFGDDWIALQMMPMAMKWNKMI